MSDEIHCPLCEYDLRGQLEPRCPECGYKFRWEDLRDPTLRLHPYLFEHHPERNIRSFFQTLVGSLRPRKFWSTLYPTQPSRPLRLIVYFALLSLFAVVPALANIGLTAAQQWSNMQRFRAQTLKEIQSPSGARFRARFPAGTTPQQILDRMYPMPNRWQMLDYAWRYSGLRSILYILIPMFAWPLLTLATMMIFRWSMAKARVRTMHVVRCVVYSADVASWINLAIGGGLMLSALAQVTGGRAYSIDAEAVCAFLAFIGWLIFSYRFTTALRLYLQFDHPKSTVLATQLITFLTVLALIANARF